MSELNEAEFHGIADDLLEDLEGRLDALDDFLDDAELTNSVSTRNCWAATPWQRCPTDRLPLWRFYSADWSLEGLAIGTPLSPGPLQPNSRRTWRPSLLRPPPPCSPLSRSKAC